MSKNKLKEFIRKLVKEYTGTGASGGNAGDGNNITSPRPFADDVEEMENYIYKSIYGGDGGHYLNEPAFNNPNRSRFGMMEEDENQIRKQIKTEIKKYYGQHDYYGNNVGGKSSISGYPGVWESLNEQEMEYTRDNTFTYNESWLKDKLGNPVKDVYEFNNDNGHMTIYPDLGNSKYKDRSSQFIRFELKDGEVHFVSAFGYEVTYDMLKNILPELPPRGNSSYAGMMTVMTDEGTIPVGIDTANKMIEAVKQGLDVEAGTQSDFYGKRGPTSGTIDEQISPDKQQYYTDKKIDLQKSLAQVDIEMTKETLKGIKSQNQQTTSQTSQQISQVEQQIQDIISKKRNQTSELQNLKAELNDVENDDDLPFDIKKKRKEEIISQIKKSQDTLNSTSDNFIKLKDQKEQLFGQQSQNSANASKQLSQVKDTIRKQTKAMNSIGKSTPGQGIQEYFNDTQSNLMERMSFYKKEAQRNILMEGAMKKFFEKFDGGMTDEEIIQDYASQGTQVPEQFVGNARRQYEGYKKLQLELEMSEKDFKNSAKEIINNPEEESTADSEDKVLASGLFKEELLKKQIKKELNKIKNKTK